MLYYCFISSFFFTSPALRRKEKKLLMYTFNIIEFKPISRTSSSKFGRTSQKIKKPIHKK